MTTYVAAGPLVNYFFYKAIGVSNPPGPNIPLDSGKIYFYADEDHSMPLDSWSDVSDPENPVVNPWPLVLGGQGDCGVIYLEDRIYFIQIFSKDDILQWTINHFNPGGDTGGSTNDALNYIPNGQFLLHNDLAATDDFEAGEIRQPVTDIAYGGWTFNRPSASTAKDIVTFDRYDEYIASPSGNPRYSVHVNCIEADSADGYKSVSVKFPNVNRFASLTQQYTVGFSAIDNIDSNTTVELYVRKNFGTGGDAEVSTLIQTFTLDANIQAFNTVFVYGTNEGKVIGTNDDDYVALDFRLKTDETVDVNLVDFLQESGNIVNPVYPETTQRFDVKESLGGGFPIPAYDGSDLYLPVRLTTNGWEFDTSDIGKIYASSYQQVEIGELFADGSQYLTSGVSSDGIPYSRLQAKLMNLSAGEILPRYGTGTNFVVALYTNTQSAPQNSLRITNNSMGIVTDFGDGSTPTGFTFNNVSDGSVNCNSWGLIYGASSSPSNTFYIRGKNLGSLNDVGISPGSSGFTVNAIRAGRPDTETVNFKTLFSVATIPASTLAGKEFEFNSNSTAYYVWYKVDGAGTNPGGPGTGILVELLSTWNAAEVSCATASAISGFKISNVITTAGSTIPAGSFWNLNTSSTEYYVWYEVDGSGTDPAPFGKMPIKVSILSADTDVEVSTKTLMAINSMYFATPDLRGMFLRGWDNGAGIDTDSALRWSYYAQLLLGDDVGSNQFDEILNHYHNLDQDTFVSGSFLSTPPGGVSLNFSAPTVLATGGSESRPLNTYVNYVIKY
jgi:hypothetical protein